MLMKPEDMIAQSLHFAAYCYTAAELCRVVHCRERFLSLAKKWEDMARNFERDRNAIDESRALLLRVDMERFRPHRV